MKSKHLKLLIQFITIFIITIILTGCTLNKTKEDISSDRFINTKFISMSTEYDLSNSDVELFFLKDDLNAYINIFDYIDMLDGLYYSNSFEFKDTVITNNILKITIEVEYSNNIVYQYNMEINFEKNTIEVDDLDFFDSYLVYPDTNYSEGLVFLPSIIEQGNKVIYNLDDYNFDLIIKDEKLLIPLSIINLLFNQDVYFDTYFNGETIYGIDTSNLDDNDLAKILKSKYNKDKLHSSLSKSSYYFYEFILDHFYGLKNDRNITSAKDFLSPNKDKLLSNKTSEAIFNVVEKLDDLHTSHLTRGYFDNKKLTTSYRSTYTGPNISNFNRGVKKIQIEAISKFGVKNNYIDFIDYEILSDNKTAVIYNLNFEVDTPLIVEEIIKKLVNTNVEDIIIDLAFNTGGNLGAVLRVFALMTDKNIQYHSKNPLNNATATYAVKGEKPAYSSFNYYVKTSSITFSAANLMASMAKELDIPVIGQNSSGGASSIGFFVFPEGSIIIMSSNMVLCNIDGGTYNSIEKGIKPNYLLNKIYDDNEIMNLINSIKNN